MSAQTVRRYGRLGVIPPVKRSQSGYRRYGPEHLEALHLVVLLTKAWGRTRAFRIMGLLHAHRLDEAFMLVHAEHAKIEVRHRALEAVVVRDDAERQQRMEPLRAREAGRVSGVAPSTIRHWEEKGLLRLARSPTSGYRLYEPAVLSRIHAIATLREASYGLDDIAQLLAMVDAGQGLETLAAHLRAASGMTMEATAALWHYLRLR